MKLNARDKILFLIVLIVAILAASWYFVIEPQMTSNDNLLSEQAAVEAQANMMKIEIASADRLQTDISSLKDSLKEKTSAYFPSIIQEKIVLIIDDLIIESGINPSNINFTNNYTFTLPDINTGGTNQDANNVTLAGLVDSFNSLQDGQTTEETTTDPTTSAAASAASLSTDLASVQSLVVDIQFTSEYSSLMKFIDKTEKMNRSIYINSMTINKMDDLSINCNMQLIIFAIPKFDDGNSDYSEWQFAGQYGNDEPFNSTTETMAVTPAETTAAP